MHAQDSSHPTGVSAEVTTGGDSAPRARQRKTNAAIQMRLAGASWNEIALTLGYPTPRTAMVSVEKALEKELHSKGDRDAMRRMAGARLERLMRSVWPKAVDPDHPEHLIAVTKARELVAQHSKLYGLDAPTEIMVHNPTQHEIEQWVAVVLTGQQPQVEEASIMEASEQEDGSYAVSTG